MSYLLQEILTALQQSFSQVNLVKYYAVAMEKHSNFGSSAISYGISGYKFTVSRYACLRYLSIIL